MWWRRALADGLGQEFSLEKVLREDECSAACLAARPGGGYFVLKFARGRALAALAAEHQALVRLAELAPGRAPRPLAYWAQGDLALLQREYIDGPTLGQLMDRAGGPLPWAQARQVALEVCRAVSQVNRAGFILRDIKPDNLVLTPQGQCAVIDLGAARQPRPQKRRDTLLYGTQGFAAPEQYGFGPSDRRTDVYGLGMTLCALLTGRADPAALDAAPIPRRVKRAVRRCVRFDPARRYQDAEQVYGALAGNGQRARRAAAALLAAALLGLLLFWLPQRGAVRTQAQLFSAIEAIPTGGAGVVQVEGLMPLDEPLLLEDRTLTLTGGGLLWLQGGQYDHAAQLHSAALTLDGPTLLAQDLAALDLRQSQCTLKAGLVLTLSTRPDSHLRALTLNERSTLRIEGGAVCHQWTGDANNQRAAVRAAGASQVEMSGGLIEAQGPYARGVLVEEGGLLTQSGGVIRALDPRTDSPNALPALLVLDAQARIMGGQLLAGERACPPVWEEHVSVSSGQELAAALEAGAPMIYLSGVIPIDQPIDLPPTGIWIRSYEGAALRFTGQGQLTVPPGGSLTLALFTLVESQGGTCLINQGSLYCNAVTIRHLGAYAPLVVNRGDLSLSGAGSAQVQGAPLLDNQGQAVLWQGDLTGWDGPMVRNEGHLTLKPSIDLPDEAIENLPGGRIVREEG